MKIFTLDDLDMSYMYNISTFIRLAVKVLIIGVYYTILRPTVSCLHLRLICIICRRSAVGLTVNFSTNQIAET